ncbi:MAG TPA: YigZ family protein [Syntrophomonadaceae bacterium]|nr:YigZ family protein [Syntrophomonadaceae bacterium]
MYYFSVENNAVEEIIIKKSRFISYISPVYDEEEVQKTLDFAKNKWPQARHYCFAYILKNNTLVERYSDAGEPSGTAGVPILSVLRNNNLENVMVVVIRYFGGILLGAPGLVRAYSQATSLVIQKAGIKRFDLCIRLQIICDYSYWGNIEHKLLQKGIIVSDIEYSDKVKAHIYCPIDEQERCKKTIIENSNGTAEISSWEKKYMSLK